MLAAKAVASPPLALMPFTTSSQAGSLRLDTTTLAPCAAICSQIERPMPRLPPVTTATLPERSNIVALLMSASLPLRRVQERPDRVNDAVVPGPPEGTAHPGPRGRRPTGCRAGFRRAPVERRAGGRALPSSPRRRRAPRQEPSPEAAIHARSTRCCDRQSDDQRSWATSRTWSPIAIRQRGQQKGPAATPAIQLWARCFCAVSHASPILPVRYLSNEKRDRFDMAGPQELVDYFQLLQPVPGVVQNARIAGEAAGIA